MRKIQGRRVGFESLERRMLLTTFYVDSAAGDDAATGTSPTDAWASVAQVNSQSLAPGDSVLFRRGASWSEQLEFDGEAGTAERRIFVGAYGSGDAPILDRLYVRSGSHHVSVEDLVIDHQKQSGDAVRVRDSAQVVLRNLEIRNGTSDGIDLTNADGILLEGLHIHHFLAGSFTDQADAHGIVASDTDGITIRNTEIHHVSGDSFQADPDRDTNITTNILIEDSRLWTGPLATDFNDGWQAGERPGENAVDTKMVKSGWDLVPRMRIEIRNVVAHGWMADSFISNKAAFNMKEKIEAVFDGVTVYDNEIGFRLRGTRGNANVTMQNVVMFDNDKAIRAEDDLANLVVHNSTFVAGNDAVFQFAGGSGGTGTWDLRNNAFVGDVPGVAADPSNKSADAADFMDASQHDYALSRKSSLVDAGVTLPSVTTDRVGLERPQGTAYDVGAYEREAKPSPAVRRARLFYNNSAYDGNGAAVTTEDFHAIATDKEALFAGEAASFTNISGYSRGINGIFIDIADLPNDGAYIDAADFLFTVGNSNSPELWASGPAPQSVGVLPGMGEDNSDRVYITFADGAVANTWLRIVVVVNSDTGLAANAEFFFGAVPGETGAAFASGQISVDAADLQAIGQSFTPIAEVGTESLLNANDLNRDGSVNAFDLQEAGQNFAVDIIDPVEPFALSQAEATASGLTISDKQSSDMELMRRTPALDDLWEDYGRTSRSRDRL